MPGDDGAFVLGFAADEHGIVAGAGDVGDDMGAGGGSGVGGIEVADFAENLGLGADQLAAFFGVAGAGFAEGGVVGFDLVGLFFQFVRFGEVVDELGRFRNLGEEGGLIAGELGLGDIGEDTVEGVVVLGGDGIEFVVVATGAGDGEAEEGFRGHVDAVVDDVVGITVEFVAERKETQGSERALIDGGLAAGILGFRFLYGLDEEAVGGELFDDELVVRFVAVEGVDDVVAVGPGVGVAEVFAAFGVALGVGVAGNIEPVTAPAFAVGGGGEEAVDEGGVGGIGIFKRIRFEGGDLGRGGREAGEVEGEAADQRAAVGSGVGGEAVVREFGEDEVIDGGFDPRRVGGSGGGGDCGLADGLERPVFFADAAVAGGGGTGLGRGGDAGIGGAAADPLGEVGDLRVSEFFALGGHLELVVFVTDRGEEEATRRLAGDEGRAGVAAGKEGGGGVEEETALDAVGIVAVALVTMLDQDGADLVFEKLEVGGGNRRGRGDGRSGLGVGGGEKE